jgi:hypothetical protein
VLVVELETLVQQQAALVVQVEEMVAVVIKHLLLEPPILAVAVELVALPTAALLGVLKTAVRAS